VYDLDQAIDRRLYESWKWRHCDEDVLPLWIADMDFKSPEPVLQALRRRIEHGVLGYAMEPPELRPVIVQWLRELYGWEVAPGELVFLSGVMAGLRLACRALAGPGDGVLLQTPGYDSILDTPAMFGLSNDEAELALRADGYYEVDGQALERAISSRTRLFALCNPHNPSGRVFTRRELETMAEICLRHKLIICSDEIHCGIVYRGHRHIPIASLDPEIARSTITLMAPSKTYNIAGVRCAFAVIQNPGLRATFEAARRGLVAGPDALGWVAALAAYRYGQPWLDEVLRYLEGNRDLAARYVRTELPGVRMYPPEASFLAWLDCRQAGIAHEIHNIRFHKFFYEQARVAVYNGAFFGRPGRGFARLNFGCRRSTLIEGLDRIKRALAACGAGE